MKKFNKKNISRTLPLLILLLVVMFYSCDEYPHEYETTDGVPTVSYVRLPDAEAADSLVSSAFLNTSIALIGDNLTSITKMWFNDQEAVLNTSFITSNSLIVTVPNEIPGTVTDKIYMLAGNDTVTYDFHVDVPAPSITSMLCEFVETGNDAVIEGSYFIDDENIPLKVIFYGNVEGVVKSVDLEQIVVTVPDGAEVGPITVENMYGSDQSSFYFRDDRNYILDWDNLDAAGGWRSGVIANSEPDGISGNYVRFQGDMTGGIGATWDEDSFSFNLWNSSNGRSEDPFYEDDLSSAALKFECYVVEEWKAAALQMIFTPYSVSGTNAYLSDNATPRALWMPWTSSGSYITDGWTTVTIPMSDFHYYHDGTDAGSSVTTDMLGGLTFFVWHGGVEGEDCTVHMCIDNIRIVPVE